MSIPDWVKSHSNTVEIKRTNEHVVIVRMRPEMGYKVNEKRKVKLTEYFEGWMASRTPGCQWAYVGDSITPPDPEYYLIVAFAEANHALLFKLRWY